MIDALWSYGGKGNDLIDVKNTPFILFSVPNIV